MVESGNKQKTFDDPTHIVQQLKVRGYILADEILGSRDMQLADYLKSIMPPLEEERTHNRYFQYVLDGIRIYLNARGEDGSAIDRVCRYLEKFPVIQQADHSGLLLDEEVFLNNFLFSLASAECGAEMMVTNQCSTVSSITSRQPLAGPVFLRSRGNLYKIFSFSKTTSKNTSFCCLPSPAKTVFEVLEGRKTERDRLIEDLSNREFSFVTEAFRLCNDEIWRRVGHNDLLPRVAIDEAATSEMLAFHMIDENSPIHKLVFNPKVRDRFITTKKDYVSSPENRSLNRAVPDFFYIKDKNRLYALILDGQGPEAAFRVEDKNTKLSIPYTPQAFAQALRSGVLYGDLMLSYLARCLLPNIVAVGGTSQSEYVSAFCEILLKTNIEEPFLNCDEQLSLRVDKFSRVGGAPLLELDERQKNEIANLSETTDLRLFAEKILKLPVEKAVGNLSCAGYLLDKYPRPPERNEKPLGHEQDRFPQHELG